MLNSTHIKASLFPCKACVILDIRLSATPYLSPVVVQWGGIIRNTPTSFFLAGDKTNTNMVTGRPHPTSPRQHWLFMSIPLKKQRIQMDLITCLMRQTLNQPQTHKLHYCMFTGHFIRYA